MFGNFRRSSSMHKRAMVPRDYIDFTDTEDNRKTSLDQDTTCPPWKLSLPHVLVATIVPFLFGYHLGVVNEPLETISVDLGFHGNTMQEGLVVSTCLAGAFLGSLISGWIADGIGRRRAFQLCALPMLVGASMCAVATSLTGMLLGRFLVGTGLGVGPPVTCLYVTEISPAHVRGTYGSFIQIATCFGFMAALLIGIPITSIFGWWRVCFWVSTIPASMLALLMMFCVESPQWLYKQGRSGEAEAELEKLVGGLHAKNAMLELSKTGRGGDEVDAITLIEMLWKTRERRAGVSSNLANVSVGIANIIGSFIALVLMDKLGRKALLLWSFFGMAISTVIQVLASCLPASTSLGFYLSTSGMLLFVLMFAVGAGPVPSLLLPEIFPSRIRAKALAFCMSVHWVLNFLVGLLFLRLLDLMGPQLLYSIFGAFCMLAVVFVKQNVLETKGKSLHEIEIALLPQE